MGNEMRKLELDGRDSGRVTDRGRDEGDSQSDSSVRPSEQTNRQQSESEPLCAEQTLHFRKRPFIFQITSFCWEFMQNLSELFNFQRKNMRNLAFPSAFRLFRSRPTRFRFRPSPLSPLRLLIYHSKFIMFCLS